MNVLIKGMEMPDKCGQCPCFHHEYPMYCQATKESSNKIPDAPYGMPRPDWCPLFEVKTPHGRLIDADAMVKVWSGCTFRGNLNPLIEVRPTVIEAEGGEHE